PTETVPVSAIPSALPIAADSTAGKILGRITVRGSDQPVASMSVDLIGKSYTADGVLQTYVAARTATDQAGRYTLNVPKRGRFYVATTTGSANGALYGPSYYPGTAELSSASAVDVQQNSVVGSIDMALFPGKAVTIRGRFI